MLAEGFEACDETPGFAVGIGTVVEAPGSEVVVGLSRGQDAPDDHQIRGRR